MCAWAKTFNWCVQKLLREYHPAQLVSVSPFDAAMPPFLPLFISLKDLRNTFLLRLRPCLSSGFPECFLNCLCFIVSLLVDSTAGLLDWPRYMLIIGWRVALGCWPWI